MKKILILATSALLITGVTFSIDNGKKKTKETKAKKENCTKGKSCSKSKTANI